ncbi:MAG: helix-turn-helix domain-containing protein [Flavobacteriaceae bacterium]|nr:helix-turn-helix domain-containing protein [Flavobacteriaceae bacterium]
MAINTGLLSSQGLVIMDSLGTSSFILTFLLGGTILIGSFVIVILLRSKALGISRFFLAGVLFFLILHLDTFLLFTTQFIRKYPHLLGVSFPTLFLIGPTYYFFVKSFNNPRFTLSRMDLLHLLPFLAMTGFQIYFYLKPLAYKRQVVEYYYSYLPSNDFSIGDWLNANLYMVLIASYTFASIYYLNRHDKKNSVLLKRISKVLIVVSTLYMVLQTGFIVQGTSAIISEIVLASLLAITILLLGYWVVDIRALAPLAKGKYETSPLTQKESTTIQQNLVDKINEEQLYLNPKLKINDIARAIHTPSHHISQVLNRNMHTNFYDFINEYRIIEAKKMLLNGALKKLSIQAIGLECGFNNKTSFYRAFKKFTGKTPSEVIKEKAGSDLPADYK